MKKRMMTVAAVAALAALALTACGGSSAGTTATQAPADTKAETKEAGMEGETTAAAAAASEDGNTLTVWTWDPNFNIYAINKAAEIYKAAGHDDFSVNVTEIVSDDIETKITTAVSAGDLSTLPDIFLMQDNSFQKYMTNYPDVFTDLTGSGIDFSQFAQAKVNVSMQDGKNFGVPFDNGTVVFAVRTDLIEQAGFKIDDFRDITWSDFMAKAKTVKEATGLPMLTVQAGSPDLLMMMIKSTGSSVFNEDGTVNMVGNEALKESMENYVQMVKDGTLVEVTDWNQYIASLNKGTVAGCINGCWILGSIVAQEDQAGKWGIVNMPRLDKAPNATNYSSNGGSSWVISSNCKNPELAIDFLKSTFAGSNALYDDLIAKGALATWAPAAKSDIYGQKVAFFGDQQIYKEIVEFAGKTPSSVTSPYYYDGRNALGVALSNITQQGADIDSEIKTAQETTEFNMGS